MRRTPHLLIALVLAGCSSGNQADTPAGNTPGASTTTAPDSAGGSESSSALASTTPSGVAGGPGAPTLTATGANTEPTGSPGYAIEELEQLIEATCDYVRTCCIEYSFPEEPLADCEHQERARYLASYPVSQYRIQPDYMASCLSNLQYWAGTGCSASWPTKDFCGWFFVGMQAEGAPCSTRQECAQGDDPTVCLKIEGANGIIAERGTCRRLAAASLGEPCLRWNDDSSALPVGSPLPGYCDWCSDGVCVAENPGVTSVGLGEACDDLHVCYTAIATNGMYCNPDGVCAPLPTSGEPCTGEAECANGGYCDSSGICRAVRIDGEACVEDQECQFQSVCSSGICASEPARDPAVILAPLCNGTIERE